MAKVYMTCGKICSGKSTYARALTAEKHAVIYSVDEITLTLFGQHCGEMHDTYVTRLERLFFDKSVKTVCSDIDVILDWGFWTRSERETAREFFASYGIECEFHYIDIDDAEWHRRLAKRNRDIENGITLDYYVDEPLAAKFESIFEAPDKDEIDVWIK